MNQDDRLPTAEDLANFLEVPIQTLYAGGTAERALLAFGSVNASDTDGPMSSCGYKIASDSLKQLRGEESTICDRVHKSEHEGGS